jgi:hypothetical protein
MGKDRPLSRAQKRKAKAAGENRDPRGLITRLHEALGPILGGLILDVVDFATLGPLGLYIGWLAGALAGLWIASIYKFSWKARVLFAIFAAIYCTIPFTGPLPLATMVSAVARFWGTERRRAGRGNQ